MNSPAAAPAPARRPVASSPPCPSKASGGRSDRGDNVDQNFDHYSCEYTFKDGAKLFLEGRTALNVHTQFATQVHGTKGCAIVSTPYPYALEALGGGVGVFVPFRDSASLAATIADLLDDPIRTAAHNLRAHAYAANMTWAKVAAAHLNLARSIADD